MRAVREIATRLHPTQPDLMLVADRAMALHLLGQDTLTELAILKKYGYPDLLALRLQLQLQLSTRR